MQITKHTIRNAVCLSDTSMRCTGFGLGRLFSFAVRLILNSVRRPFLKVRLQDRNYQHKSEQDNNCCRCDKAGNRALLALFVIADIVVLFENRTRNQAGDGKEEGKERKPEAAGIVQRCIKD